MDIEQPDAALIISIALNKKNEVAMKTGHLEIMSALQSLCKPNPQGEVPYEPVKEKMIDLYGAEVAIRLRRLRSSWMQADMKTNI